MKNQPLVSVVIPCYNDGKYIIETIESIYDQTYKQVEIIIVDAGSEEPVDSTKFVSFASLDIRLLRVAERIYPGQARNFAFGSAKGEYILLVDADDILDSTFLEKSVRILSGHPQIGVVSANAVMFGYRHGMIESKVTNLEDILVFCNCVGCGLVRRSTWISAGGYDETMINGYEEWDLYVRITKRNWSLFIIPENLIFYRQKQPSEIMITKKNYSEIHRMIVERHVDIYIHPYNFLKKIFNLKPYTL